MANASTSVRVTRGLLAVLAGLWFIFGLIVLAGVHPSYRELGVLRWGLAVGGLVAGMGLAVLTMRLGAGRPFAFWLLTALLSTMLIAGLLDELGLADAIYLAFTAAPLALLLRDRAWYLHAGESTAEGLTRG